MEVTVAVLTDRHKEMMMSTKKFLNLIIMGLVVATASACGGDQELTGPGPDVDNLFWALEFNYRGVTLSVDDSRPEYNTLQLVATPRTINGEVIEGLGMPTFTSSDTTTVIVDSTGLITAKKGRAAPVLIVARLVSTEHQITNYDTAYVVVTNTVTPPSTFAISAGRTTYGIGFDTVLKARMTDANGDPLTGVKVSYMSSDPGLALIDSGGIFQPKKEGTVTITASTISYGSSFADTLTLTIGPPEVFEVSLVAGTDNYAGFYPDVVTIKAGQGIAWNSSIATGAKFGDVTFDNPENVGPSPVDGSAGNIGAFILRKHIRTFSVPGTYTYRNSMNGDTGRVIVTP